MRVSIIIVLFLFAQNITAQMSLTYTNYGSPIVLANESFRSSKIHEIIIHPDSTYEFWSKPHGSCLTWHSYKGTWRKEKDTLVFSDHYEVMENDMRISYQKDASRAFLISFTTDNSKLLTTREVKVKFIYDFKEDLEDRDSIFDLNVHNTLKISFNSIPYFNQLAAIKIEYQLNDKEKRSGYLTTNKTLNLRQGDIPNIIGVQFVETPKKETVYRTFKGVFQDKAIVIVSDNKTRTMLPDYQQDIEFENSYRLTR